MDDIQQPGRPGPGDDRIPAGPPQPDPAQAPPSAVPPPPPSAPPPPPRRLTRSDEGRVIAGVAGGIARHLSVDPTLVRIVFAVLSFTGGVGFLLYIAGWLALPSESEPEAPGVTLLRRLGRGGWRAYLVVVVGVIVVAALAGDIDPGHPGLVWGVLLLGFGVALLIREDEPHPAAPGAATAPAGPVPGWGAPSAAPAPVRGWGQLVPRRTRRRSRSPLTRITLAAVLLVAAGAGLLGDAGVVSVSVQTVLALCLTVIGAGLIVGSWWRPPYALIVLGLLLVPMVFAAGISDVPIHGGAGDRLWEPQTVSQLGDGYQLGAGSLTVDLSRVPFGQGPATVHLELGIGQLDVVVPADVPLDVHARVGAGEARLLDRVDNGLAVDTRVRADGSAALGRLSLDLHTGLGQVTVRRAGTATVQGAL
ncbi:MAG TPA: PspC domain-containing protein [Candidatus Dormibacteraeota bacterium]